MPLIACSTAPPRPCQKLDWRSISETRSGSTAGWPRSKGQSSSTAPATSFPEVKQLPRPIKPSSLLTMRSVCRFSCGSCPCGQPPSTVPPVSGQTSIATIFTTYLQVLCRGWFRLLISRELVGSTNPGYLKDCHSQGLGKMGRRRENFGPLRPAIGLSHDVCHRAV